MVITFKPYLMQKNLFKLFALTGGRDAKLWAKYLYLGTSAHAIARAEPPGDTFADYFFKV